MPTFKKIPQKVKDEKAIAIGPFAVFCKGILKAAEVVKRLEKAEQKNGSIPAHGSLMYKNQQVYYCRVGLVNDADIYEAPKKVKGKKQ